MPSQGAKHRVNAKRAQLKNASAKADKQARDAPAAQTIPRAGLTIPYITEDDLLAFQSSHFSDDAKPESWFIDAETALEYDPGMEADEDDGLGYYDDGVKRTLTDEQVEMFRHSEMEQLARGEKLMKEGQEQEKDALNVDNDHETNGDSGVPSPVSNIPSPSVTTIGCALPPGLLKPSTPGQRRTSSSAQSDSAASSATKKKKGMKKKNRKYEVPYEDRHKRQWEAYIEKKDEVQGSMTHRRLVRELDGKHEVSVDLDY